MKSRPSGNRALSTIVAMDGVSMTPEHISRLRQSDLLSQYSVRTDNLRQRAQRLADEQATSEARRGLLEAFNNSLQVGDRSARRELLSLLREELSCVQQLLQLEQTIADEEVELSARLLKLQIDLVMPAASDHGIVIPVVSPERGADDTIRLGAVDSRQVHELAIHLADMHPRIHWQEADRTAQLVATHAISSASDAATAHAELARETQRSMLSSIPEAAAELNSLLASAAQKVCMFKDAKQKLQEFVAEQKRLVDEDIREM